MSKFNITIKQNAATNTVQVETDIGKTLVNMSELSNIERIGVRELVVNSFCRHNRFVEMY